MTDLPHLLTVVYSDDELDEVEYVLECPAPGNCGLNLWDTCTECPIPKRIPDITPAEQDEGVVDRHGIEHRFFHASGDWLVETNRCYGVYWAEYEGVCDAADTAAVRHPELGDSGEHRVHIWMEDDEGIRIEPWREG